MLEKFERIKLGHFPTPIEHLKNISKYLGGPNIFIKSVCFPENPIWESSL